MTRYFDQNAECPSCQGHKLQFNAVIVSDYLGPRDILL